MFDDRGEHLEAVLAQDPFDAPTSIRRSPMPICHASSLEEWWSFFVEHRLFVQAYRMAPLEREGGAERFRRGGAIGGGEDGGDDGDAGGTGGDGGGRGL